MIFVLTIINNVNNVVRTKIIGHYSLLVTHYSEYKHPLVSVHNVILWRVFFYIKLNNKEHIKRKIAENLAYLFCQYFNMNVSKRRNCIAIDDAFTNLSCN